MMQEDNNFEMLKLPKHHLQANIQEPLGWREVFSRAGTTSNYTHITT